MIKVSYLKLYLSKLFSVICEKKDDKEGDRLKLKNVEPIFSSLNVMPAKITKIINYYG